MNKVVNQEQLQKLERFENRLQQLARPPISLLNPMLQINPDGSGRIVSENSSGMQTEIAKFDTDESLNDVFDRIVGWDWSR